MNILYINYWYVFLIIWKCKRIEKCMCKLNILGMELKDVLLKIYYVYICFCCI